MKKTMDCTKPYTGIISRLESLPAQEKPAMAATPSPPRSPCLTVVMMVPLACCREVGGGKAEDVLRVACLEHLPAEGQTQFGLAQVGQHVPRSGDLCGSGSTAAPATPKGPTSDRVQHDVHHAGGDYGPERCFRVSAAHDALFGQVIEHQKGQADQIHPPIEHRLSQDLLRVRMSRSRAGRVKKPSAVRPSASTRSTNSRL